MLIIIILNSSFCQEFTYIAGGNLKLVYSCQFYLGFNLFLSLSAMYATLTLKNNLMCIIKSLSLSPLLSKLYPFQFLSSISRTYHGLCQGPLTIVALAHDSLLTPPPTPLMKKAPALPKLITY